MMAEIFGKKVRIDASLLEVDEGRLKEDIKRYLDGKLKSFEYRIKYHRIPHSLRDLIKALITIPYGETRTYGEIGKMINMHPRKVGILCSKNPLPIVVPCHRVVGKNDIGGYSYGRELKIKLLEHEKSHLI